VTEAPLTAPVVSPDEALYQQARQELAAPKPLRVTGLVFIALFLFFVAGVFRDLKSASGILVLLLVIVFHEAGHAAGMRLFGFRDVRMFFIPFFGAAVSGRSRGVAAWKEALVSLLGPLPGIIAGIVIYIVMQRQPFPWSVNLVQSLLLLNGFNLLPFGFLDGGRFLERVLFSRHRVLEVGFQAIGCLLLGVLAIRASLYMLGFFALFTVTRLPLRWRTLTVAAKLRKAHPGLVPDPDNLGDGEGRTVFGAARGLLPLPAGDQPAPVARSMEAILDGMKRAPGALASIGLLFIYGVGLLAATFGIVLIAGDTRSASWQPFQQANWSAEFPATPSRHQPRSGPEAGGEVWRAVIEGTERFTVSITAGGDDGKWQDAARDQLVKETGLRLESDRPFELDGHPGRELALASPRRVLRGRLVAVGGRRYMVTASAPRWGDNQQRFFASFLVRPGPRP
jgi:Zn-dependent protease